MRDIRIGAARFESRNTDKEHSSMREECDDVEKKAEGATAPATAG